MRQKTCWTALCNMLSYSKLCLFAYLLLENPSAEASRNFKRSVNCVDQVVPAPAHSLFVNRKGRQPLYTERTCEKTDTITVEEVYQPKGSPFHYGS